MSDGRSNTDEKVVADFGAEWSRFQQDELSPAERQRIFDSYFRIFPWNVLPDNPVGADVGCGSGRWAVLVAPRVGQLHCIDASPAALAVARRNLQQASNVEFHVATADDLPFEDGTLDFAYSLGVLHHVPDTAAAIRGTTRVLKPGAPLLLYLYYAFDNRPAWFKLLWRTTDMGRRLISRLPGKAKNFVCDAIAITFYWPVARLGSGLHGLRMRPATWPLAAYSDKSLYTMRTDSLDRFGTRLEHRFTRDQIRQMMSDAGLERISFSDVAPYWCAVGYARQ